MACPSESPHSGQREGLADKERYLQTSLSLFLEATRWKERSDPQSCPLTPTQRPLHERVLCTLHYIPATIYLLITKC